MNRLSILAKMLVVGIVVSFGTIFTQNPRAAADELPATSNFAINAACFDASNALTYWSVTNPDASPMAVGWATDDGDESGTYTAPTGTSQFTTPYDDNEPSESFIFSPASQDDVTLTVAGTECAQPTTPPCVDGMIRSNLAMDWSEETGTVTLHTVDDAPLCDDVTVYLSSYTLPATYDKSGIFDDSSLPQQYFDSTSAVLQKGTAGDVTLTVGTPNACTDFQMDIYYAPEIINVPYAGHSTQLIYGNIHLATATDCSGAPGMGGGQLPPDTTPSTPPTPVVAPAPPVSAPVTVAAAPKQLADTGASPLMPTLGALLTLGVAIFVRRTPTKQ